MELKSQVGGQWSGTTIIDRVISAGHYAREGPLLLLSDSATSRRFVALVVNDTIGISSRDTIYRFRPKPPPSLYESLWAEFSCSSATGGDPGCPATNSSGVVSTTIGGGLQFDINVPDGHYAWETEYEYRHPDGVTDTAVVSKTGTYTWDGSSLSMQDGSSGETMTGHLTKPLLMIIQSRLDVFTFHRFPPAPDARPYVNFSRRIQ